MKYSVDFSGTGSVFAVPASVVDEHLRLCGALQLKVLLLLLRKQQSLSAQELADELHQSASDVRDAVVYWLDRGLIKADSSENQLSTDAVPVQASVQSELEQKNSDDEVRITVRPSLHGNGRRTTILTDDNRPSRAQCIELAKQNAELRQLLQRAQDLLGRTLNSMDTQCITSLYCYHGLSSDFILMVMGYCKSIDKFSLRYVEKTAANWVEQGVDSYDKAEAHIRKLMHNHSNEGQVRSAFGINDRSLISSERKFIETWFGEYGFDISMIRLAYERTIESIGKLSFPYINKVLKRWHDEGIQDTKAAANESSKPKATKKSSGATSYDLSDIENRILDGFSKNN